MHGINILANFVECKILLFKLINFMHELHGSFMIVIIIISCLIQQACYCLVNLQIS